MRKLINPWIGKDGYDCFGCNPENPIGLHMEFYEDGDYIISFLRPQEHLQGWVNTVHGGILSTIIDEIAGWTVSRKLQTTGVTSRLEVNYRHPVAVTEQQLTVRARIREMKRNLAFIDATIENSRGETCVEGTAVYFTFGPDKAREMGCTRCDAVDEQLLSM